jgi:uncharacterized protein YbjQ (UPF0145 family)
METQAELRKDLIAGTRPEITDKQVLLTSAEGFDGYEITDYLDMVWGITVRSKDMGQDCGMACKAITGGELESYSALGNETRQQSLDRMMEMANRVGANAVINVQFELSGMNTGNGQVVAFGTGVKIEPIKGYVPAGAVGNILLEIKDTLAKK